MKRVWRGMRKHWGKVVTLLALAAALRVVWWALPVRPRMEVAFVDRFDTSVSPDQCWLAVIGYLGPRIPRCGPVSVIDVASGHIEFSVLDHSTQVAELRFSGDGRLLAIEDPDGNVTVWEVPSGKLRGTLTTSPNGGDAFRAYRNLRFVPGCHLIAYQRFDTRTLVFWDADSGSDIRELDGATTPFEFSPDGRKLAASTLDGRLLLWDVATSQPHAQLPGYAPIGDPQFSSDGQYLACLLKPTQQSAKEQVAYEVYLWDVKRNELRMKLPLQNGFRLPTAGVAFTPNGRHLLASTQTDAGFWLLTSTPPPDLLSKFVAATRASVTFPIFSRDGSRVAFALPGLKQLTVLDAESVERITTWQVPEGLEHAGRTAQFTPDGRQLAVTVTDGTGGRSQWDEIRIRLSGKLGLPTPGLTRDVDRRFVRLFEIDTGRDEFRIPGGEFLLFGPDCKTVITSARENEYLPNRARVHVIVRIWDLPPRKPLGWFLAIAAVVLALPAALWWRARRSANRERVTRLQLF